MKSWKVVVFVKKNEWQDISNHKVIIVQGSNEKTFNDNIVSLKSEM